jgi:hypothetical protein
MRMYMYVSMVWYGMVCKGISDHQSPITNHQSSIINHQSSIVNNQAGLIVEQQPASH